MRFEWSAASGVVSTTRRVGKGKGHFRGKGTMASVSTNPSGRHAAARSGLAPMLFRFGSSSPFSVPAIGHGLCAVEIATV
jgi:hypothetical protein